MVDTTTTRLGLLKQETGGNNNSWGDNLNTSVIDLLDAIIAGVHSISTTGGTTTLVEAERRKGIINVTGTLASNAIIVVDNLEKAWTVRNGCTLGSFTVTMKTTSGSAVTVPAGVNAVFCDGSNAMYCTTAASGGGSGTFLELAGGTLTGALLLHTSSPSTALQAASKGYVDNNFLTSVLAAATYALKANACVGRGSFTYTGGSVTLTKSSNIASVSRVGQGIFDVAFTTGIGGTNYQVVSGNARIAGSPSHPASAYVINKTSSGFRIATGVYTGAATVLFDPDLCDFAVFGGA